MPLPMTAIPSRTSGPSAMISFQSVRARLERIDAIEAIACRAVVGVNIQSIIARDDAEEGVDAFDKRGEL